MEVSYLISGFLRSLVLCVIDLWCSIVCGWMDGWKGYLIWDVYEI